MRLFRFILDALLPPRSTERLLRLTTVDDLMKLSRPEHFALSGAQASGLLPYHDERVRAFILEAKFHGSVRAQEALGAVLAEYLTEYVADESAFGRTMIVVPLPLGKKRIRERGYNQTEAICTAALKRMGGFARMMPDVLARVRDTAPQTKLAGSDRRENVRGAFRAKAGLDPSHTYIVVDDVVTTGATLLAATESLRAAGAVNVSAIALAH